MSIMVFYLMSTKKKCHIRNFLTVVFFVGFLYFCFSLPLIFVALPPYYTLPTNPFNTALAVTFSKIFEE